MNIDRVFPMLVLVLVWVFFSGLVTAKGKKKNGTQGQAKPFVPPMKTVPREKDGAQKKETRPAEEAERFTPAEKRVLQPSVSVTDHDDSIYQGSMNALTGEGHDPCHEEQMSVLSAAEQINEPTEEAQEGGLRLEWTGNEIVRGFVMSEILTRKQQKRA